MFLHILPITQLFEWCFWFSLLEQFKNKKQLFVVLKKQTNKQAIKKNRDNLNTFKHNFSDTHREKLCFIQLSTRIHRNRCLAAPDVIHIFTQFVKLFTFHCDILNSVNFLIRWFMKLPENERLLISATFTAKVNWFLT